MVQKFDLHRQHANQYSSFITVDRQAALLEVKSLTLLQISLTYHADFMFPSRVVILATP
jgi:hypothetical protein